MSRGTRFDLLRHGQTVWNLERRMQGQTETELTERGRGDARAWADRLDGRRYGLLLRSDLERAGETAAIINARLGLVERTDCRLREQHWGEWTGRTVAELDRLYREELYRQESLGWGFTPPGGESRGQVRDRALACLYDVAEEHPGERILVVTHLGVIKGLVYQALGGEWLGDGQKPFKNRLLQSLECINGMIRIRELDQR